MKGSGIALKFLQWFIRGVQFCCAAVVLALTSYFLATLHSHDLTIATWLRAVEGISGAAVVYTIAGLLLLCCIAGYPLISFIAITLDIAFIGAFIYVAVSYKGGVGTCTNIVETDNPRTNCNMQKANFAVSIIAM